MANYYGIDFGTTNSAVYSIAEINGEISEEFPIGEDDRQPSRWITAWAAPNWRLIDIDNFVYIFHPTNNIMRPCFHFRIIQRTH